MISKNNHGRLVHNPHDPASDLPHSRISRPSLDSRISPQERRLAHSRSFNLHNTMPTEVATPLYHDLLQILPQ